jgi:hypothetical protein
MRALVLLFLLGCNGDDSGHDAGPDATSDVAAPTTPCSGDFDCPNSGEKCWFVVDGGCTLQNLKGSCLPFTPPDKCAPTVACGCDGTTISVCAPVGYVDRPSNTAGACATVDSGADAGDDGGGGGDAGTD